MRERERKRKKESKLLSSILGVSPVGIRQAKSESSSTRRGLHVCKKKKKDFTEDPKEGISGNQGFRAREPSHPCYYASRGRDSSYLGLFFTFWVEKWEF